MWCTRWFLPLLLLPLPTAPPFFLLLFLLSLTMHAKPCFYCIVLLTTLFVSSCYWQPFPLNTPLSTPWSENITTFADALNSTLSPNYSKPLPNVMRAVDRCWCDFSAGGFFEPFNVTHWEYTSVKRLKDDLERHQKIEEDLLRKSNNISNIASSPLLLSTLENSTLSRTPHHPSTHLLNSTIITSHNIRSFFRFVRYAFQGDLGLSTSLSSLVNPSPLPSTLPSPSREPINLGTKMFEEPHSHVQTLPLIRREYDLRPYGLDILVDFNWT